MNEEIWSKALKIISLDSRVDEIYYNTILNKMKQVSYDNDILVLSCRDDYSLSLVKGQELEGFIKSAVGMVTDRDTSVMYVVEGDNAAAINSIVSETKVKEKDRSAFSSSELTDEFTFENFIVGDCNRFAHASAISVAENPGLRQKNPLYLWGNSGLGKTHLMKAVGYRVKQLYPNKKVLYTTCEDESLVSAGKQIVITSDKSPKSLPELDPRLTTRFQNGVMMDIQPPDYETRKAIFINKMNSMGISFDDDIVEYVCENVTNNVRELNGAFNIISTYYALENGNINLELIMSKLAPIISPSKNKQITVEVVIDAVSKYYDITPDKLLSNVRSADIVNARSVAMYICRDLLGMQYTKIGEFFGGKKHSTVMHACNKLADDPFLMSDVNVIEKRIADI